MPNKKIVGEKEERSAELRKVPPGNKREQRDCVCLWRGKSSAHGRLNDLIQLRGQVF